jgi:hypothetical protein
MCKHATTMVLGTISTLHQEGIEDTRGRHSLHHHHNAEVHVTVWTTAVVQSENTITAAAATASPSLSQLTYFTYHDDAWHFTHTLALLERVSVSLSLSSSLLTTLHVASTLRLPSPASTTPALLNGDDDHESRHATNDDDTDTSLFPRAVQRLLRVVNEWNQTQYQPSDDDDDVVERSEDPHNNDDTNEPTTTQRPPARRRRRRRHPTTSVQYHATYFTQGQGRSASKTTHKMTVDMERLQSVLEQHLTAANRSNNSNNHNTTSKPTTTAKTQWLQLTSDVDWQQQQPQLAMGCIFYLRVTGLWCTTPSTAVVASSSGTDTSRSFTSITKGRLPSVLSLDATAAAALHLWPPSNVGMASVVGGTTTTNSVYGLLGAACSTLRRDKMPW